MSLRATRLDRGLLGGVGAYVLWGVFPIYFHLLREVAPMVVLCHRIAWSCLFLAIVISFRGEWDEIVDTVRKPKLLGLLSIGAVLIAVNWLIFIYAVGSGRVLESSMGYFINPVLSVALGLVFLRERLRPWQWVAVGIATTAVANLAFRQTGVPWIALSLAFSFGLYGLVRKQVHLNSLHALAIESAILLPVALGTLALLPGASGGRFFGWLTLSGILTATPLLLFGVAVRRLKLSTLGFLQYIGPSLQFLLATAVFNEPLNGTKLSSFVLCWIAIVVFAADTVISRRAPDIADEPD